MNDELTSKESSSILMPALISGTVGAGLALLFTPKSGKEIRGDLMRYAKTAGEQAYKEGQESKATLDKAVQKAQESLAAEAEKASEITAARSVVVPVLISGILGAAVALLFAPKAGKEVMRDIRDIASSAADKSKNLYQKGAAAVKETWEKGKEAAIEQKEKLRPAA